MDISKINGSSTSNFSSEATQSATQASDDSFAKKLEAAVNSKDDKELMKACQDFEGIMLNMMYKSMKATVIKSDLVEEDSGTEIFESMQDESLMDEISKSGSFGLAESLYKQLSKRSGTGVNNVKTEAAQESKPVIENSGE